MTTALVYDPYSPEVNADPYPFYERLRREAPVYRVERHQFFVVTRYDDCVAILTNPERFSSAEGPGPERSKPGGGADTLITCDPPRHSRYRGLVAKAFTPKIVAQLEPKIQSVVNELLDAFADQGQVDLIPALAYPLPMIVIAELLGVPVQDRDLFKRWSDDFIRAIGGNLDDAGRAQFGQTVREFVAYFQDIVADRREHPQEDLITGLVQAEIDGEALNRAEIISICNQFLVAGHETTTGLIGNGMKALLSHPDQLARLQAEPDLLPNAVDEALRYDAPIQGLFRTSTADTELRGVPIPPGSKIMVMYGAANRDPEKFPDPDQFDLARSNASWHLAFGRGIHFCIGAHLAKLEARIAFRTLFARLPALRLVPDQPDVRETAFFVRSLKALELAFNV